MNILFCVVEEQVKDDTYFCYSEFRANALVRQTLSNRNMCHL